MKVLFAVTDGADPLSLFAVHAALTAADEKIEIEIAAREALVTLAGGARLVANRLAWELAGVDAVVVPARTLALGQDASLLAALRRAPPSLRFIAAIADGANVLAAAGLLDGRKVADGEARVAFDGRVATAHAPSDALDLGLAIVACLIDAHAEERARRGLGLAGPRAPRA